METEFLTLLLSAGTSIGVTWFANKAGPLETLNSLWYLGFGYFDEKVKDKKHEAQIKREQTYLDDTIKKTAENIANIPEEHIQEPRENIAKPAIDALRIYASEEHLRTIFSKILASSMDSRLNGHMHPAFVEIVKQLSPLDAENLLIIYNQDGIVPIVNVHQTIKNLINGNDFHFQVYFENLFILNPNEKNYQLHAASLENISRLGLINLNYSAPSPRNIYDDFKKTSIYLEAEIDNSLKNKKNPKPTLNGDPVNFTGVKLQPGSIDITSLGSNLCSICL
ncbi:MAG: DUF4393 domain-containing protein [Carnobacterium sp.]|uniref:DUF4393 domain-containing protein n=1 Tax=Carnobacterium sp. TaxID=48221 RepID=UPI002FC75665